MRALAQFKLILRSQHNSFVNHYIEKYYDGIRVSFNQQFYKLNC